jgi:hypothetical protein
MSEPEAPREDLGEDKEPEVRPTSRRARNLGLALMAVAVLLWTMSAVVLFLPLPGGQKVWTVSALAVGGEVFFWISAAVLGREVYRRYRSYLDPRRLFRRRDS